MVRSCQRLLRAELLVDDTARQVDARIHLTDDGVDIELVAHRVDNLLGLQLRAVSPTTIELVGWVDAATGNRLAGWLNHHNATSRPCDYPNTVGARIRRRGADLQSAGGRYASRAYRWHSTGTDINRGGKPPRK